MNIILEKYFLGDFVMLNCKYFYLTTIFLCSISSLAKADVYGPPNPNEIISSSDPNNIIDQSAQKAAEATTAGLALKLLKQHPNTPENPFEAQLDPFGIRHCTERDDNCKATTADDTVYTGGGNDFGYGLAGNDGLYGQAGNDRLYGNEGDDELRGGDGLDILYGGQGNDKLLGESQNDTLYGDKGLDTLDGGDGWDTLYGGEDNDSLEGGQGDDTLYGGQGDDTLDGGEGNDTLYGDKGNNTIRDYKGKNKAIILGKDDSKTEIWMNQESTLEIPDTSSAEVKFTKTTAGDLLITTLEGRVVAVVKGYFDATRSGALAQIKFSNATLERWMIDQQIVNPLPSTQEPKEECNTIWGVQNCQTNYEPAGTQQNPQPTGGDNSTPTPTPDPQNSTATQPQSDSTQNQSLTPPPSPDPDSSREEYLEAYRKLEEFYKEHPEMRPPKS